MGARILWHAPGLSATAIVLIALVVGGNTTIYSMVNSLLVSPARGVTADRLVVVRHLEAGVMLTDPFISYPNYEDYARLTTTVTGLTAWSTERLTLRTDAGNYAVWGGLVTSNYFSTLGVGIAHGRALDTEDDNAVDGVAGVISHRVWRERFAAAPDAIGRVVVVNRVPVTVVGVAAEGFTGAVMTPGEDVWLPIRAYYRAIGNRETLANRSETVVLVAGHLADGASLADARAEFLTLLAQLYAEGDGVPRSDADAVRWFLKAAEGGDAIAQIEMGVRFATGHGVSKDDAQSLMWEQRSAAQGNGEAMRFLGVRHEEGRGVPRDFARATAYFLQAAEAGDVVGMCNLGDMYAWGKGVTQSHREAYRWYLTASAAGNEKCEANLSAARRRLSRQEREAAERDARAWAARFSS